MTNKEVIKYIKSDIYRYYGKSDFAHIFFYYCTRSLMRFHVNFRMAQGRGIIKYIGLFMWAISSTRKKIRLPISTKVGYGLYIGHGGPIVVNPNAIIGNNVNLSQFTTIGSNHNKGAIIGDNTYIGPNVCIVEDVKIGKNVTIGAGSVVTKDIPDNATACGNYAKVINYNNPGRYTKGNRWEDL